MLFPACVLFLFLYHNQKFGRKISFKKVSTLPHNLSHAKDSKVSIRVNFHLFFTFFRTNKKNNETSLDSLFLLFLNLWTTNCANKKKFPFRKSRKKMTKAYGREFSIVVDDVCFSSSACR